MEPLYLSLSFFLSAPWVVPCFLLLLPGGSPWEVLRLLRAALPSGLPPAVGQEVLLMSRCRPRAMLSCPRGCSKEAFWVLPLPLSVVQRPKGNDSSAYVER